jgi:hypothetical protein
LVYHHSAAWCGDPTPLAIAARQQMAPRWD